MMKRASSKPGIREYFSGKNIFITGGSGFIGKLLIEKLLRDCPKIGNIYILMREKKGDSIEKRLEQVLENKLYNTLRKQNVEAFKKIIPLKGDTGELNLGLSEQDLLTIKENVHVIYHSAASIRFDDFLKTAILLNTRSAREVVLIAKETKHLEVLMHVSTTYCNADRQTIDEKVYPPHGDWRESIELAEQYDSHTLDILTEKITGKLPNTYTYTKSLAEHVVNDLCDGQLPAVIFRPSIVTPSIKDPVPGWTDNFNGPIGLLLVSAKGILRSAYMPPENVADYIPVDITVKSMIIATWRKATCLDATEKLKTKVYNGNNSVQIFTYKDMSVIGSQMFKRVPLNNIVWYPDGELTKCWYNHFYKLILYQLIPALLIDGLLKLTGRKPMLFKLHRKIYIANMALEFFMQRSWTFLNSQCLQLDQYVHKDEIDSFAAYKGFKEIALTELYTYLMIGSRKYLLNESKESFENAKKHTMRMWYLYLIWNTLWYIGIVWLIYRYVDIAAVWYRIEDYFVPL